MKRKAKPAQSSARRTRKASTDWPNEPRGWSELWEKAQREKNPKRLAALIDKMNRLLAEYEKKDRTN